MLIGFDYDSKNNNDGMGTASRALCESLEKRCDIKIIYVLNTDNKKTLRFYISKIQKKIIRILSKSYFDNYFERYQLSKIIKDKKIDIYHTLGGTLPDKSNCITIQTCYDISYYYDKNYLPANLVNYYEKFVKKSAFIATHIVAASNSTKMDLIKIWKIPESKISVIHLGVDINKFKLRKISNNSFKNITGINFKYLLFVGNLNTRKNGLRLIQSFQLIYHKAPNLKLLFVGSSGNEECKMRDLVNEFNLVDRVLFLGRVSDDMLISFYQNAEVFCYPSLHEGFGLPILEAMAAGTPVLTSNNSSMSEISGDAAILVDPYDIHSIADGIIKALLHRNSLVAKGFKNVKNYTWDFSADKLVNLYIKLIKNNSI
jgi:glycosyltransferase involved in cell wall biosynthesis